jgi:hypothetical protein
MFNRNVARMLLWELAFLITLLGCHQAQPAGTSPTGSVTHDLSEDEDSGGHTLHRHTGRTDEQLRQRLRDEPNISAASTYTDRVTAEKVVGATLQHERARVEQWLEQRGGHPNLVLDYDGDPANPIGRTLRRGQNTPEPCSHAVVVLRWAGGGEYYVLTSYPECR